MKVFITGAAGYIGSSVAYALAKKNCQVKGLARSKDKGRALESAGVELVQGALDDYQMLSACANWADIVINAADSEHFASISCLIATMKGSGKRLIHTSGSSIVADDAKGEYASEKIFDDDAPFVPLIHRTPRNSIDQLVRNAGIFDGIRTSVICPTLVYGTGYNGAESRQIPLLIKQSKEEQAGIYIGSGQNIWSNVFIDDLVQLYVLAMERAPSASFFFAENGENSIFEIAQIISNHIGKSGEIKMWTFEEAVSKLGFFADVALASNCRVRATNAKNCLGWKPSGPSLEHAYRLIVPTQRA